MHALFSDYIDTYNHKKESVVAITVSIELNRELEIPASYDEVFDLFVVA